MSYSISFTVPSKAEAKARVATEMDNIVASQPIHAKDRGPVIAIAESFIDLLRDDDSKDVQVQISGYLAYDGYSFDPTNPNLTTASVSAIAYSVPRAAIATDADVGDAAEESDRDANAKKAVDDEDRSAEGRQATEG